MSGRCSPRRWPSARGPARWRRPPQAQAHCDEATELADGLSDEELAPRLNTLAHLASSDVYFDRFPAATRHAQRALNIGRATGQGQLFLLVAAMLRVSLWVQGRPWKPGTARWSCRGGAARRQHPEPGLEPVQPQLRCARGWGPQRGARDRQRERRARRRHGAGAVFRRRGRCARIHAARNGQADRCLDVLLTRAGARNSG